MSLITAVDRSGVRWVMFNSLHIRLTRNTSKIAARDLQNVVADANIREYQQLDLDVDQQIKSELSKNKYINDRGILEYVTRSNGQKETIDGILEELGLAVQTEVNTNVTVYQDTLVFNEDDKHIEGTFCMLNVFGKIWIEAVKLCQFFDYANPWQAIQTHITDENKSTVGNLLLQTGISSTSPNVQKTSRNPLLGNLSPDLMFINETGIWQLSQHSRKPMLKRFWANMCKTLSERYNMVFDVQRDEVFAVPKHTTSVTDEAMDVDGNNYKVLVLEAQLRASEAEKKANEAEKKAQSLINEAEKNTLILQNQYTTKTKDLELELVTEKCKVRELQAMHVYNIDRSVVVDSLFLNQLTETAVQKKNLELVTGALRKNEYTVAQSISEVNPSKETIIAFIWLQFQNAYSAVCQIRESFDKQYRFIKLDAQDGVKHRTSGVEPKRHNEGQRVLIGKEFASCSAQGDWTRFKDENPYMMFGVEFVNTSQKEFKILTKQALRDKYEMYLNYANTLYNVDDDVDLTRNERIMIKYNLSLFNKIGVSTVDECLEWCFVPDIWFMYACLKSQMDRDHLTEIEQAAADEAANVRTQMHDRTVAIRDNFKQKYENSYSFPPYMAQQFANMETMSTLDADNVDKYDNLLAGPRSIRNEVTATTDTPRILSGDNLKIDKFLNDLCSKRQNKPN